MAKKKMEAPTFLGCTNYFNRAPSTPALVRWNPTVFPPARAAYRTSTTQTHVGPPAGSACDRRCNAGPRCQLAGWNLRVSLLRAVASKGGAEILNAHVVRGSVHAQFAAHSRSIALLRPCVPFMRAICNARLSKQGYLPCDPRCCWSTRTERAETCDHYVMVAPFFQLETRTQVHKTGSPRTSTTLHNPRTEKQSGSLLISRSLSSQVTRCHLHH